jgi:HK97 family phage major capsid protein
VPIYQPNLQGQLGGTLYGYPMSELTNGAWDMSEAELLMGDWSKAIVGVRQDISFKLFTEGVISDDDGKVVLNLMQQDSVAMRVVMRVAFATANPATRLNTDSATRSPFAAVQTTTAAS